MPTQSLVAGRLSKEWTATSAAAAPIHELSVRSSGSSGRSDVCTPVAPLPEYLDYHAAAFCFAREASVLRWLLALKRNVRLHSSLMVLPTGLACSVQIFG